MGNVWEGPTRGAHHRASVGYTPSRGPPLGPHLCAACPHLGAHTPLVTSSPPLSLSSHLPEKAPVSMPSEFS